MSVNMKKRTLEQQPEAQEIAKKQRKKEQKQKETKQQIWMWLFEIFDEQDGRGANGDPARIQVQIKDKEKVNEADKYGWIDIEEDEYHLEPEVESMDMQVLTEDLYNDLECVTDEVFLKKWENELKELTEFFMGKDSEKDSDSEEDE